MPRLILLFFISLLLSGCFLAPGMRMKPLPPSVHTKGANFDVKPCFIPINVSLVRKLNHSARINLDDAYYYHVDPHDILNIFVWGHKELNPPTSFVTAESGQNSMLSPTVNTSGYLVDSDGNISFPLIGTVHVAGYTVQQDQKIISKLLRKYIKNPQVDVRVSGFRSKKIYVMGEVVRPGIQPLTDAPMSITDSINLASGLDLKTADPENIFVIRGDYEHPNIYWLNAGSPDALILAENFRLKNNDIVFISTAQIARWNRAIEQVLPTIQTAWFTYSLIHNN